MPVVGPSYQVSPPQVNAMQPIVYPGYGGPPYPFVQSVSDGSTQIGPPTEQFVSPSGPGYIPTGIGGPNGPMGGPGILGMTMHDQAEAARMAQDYEALVNIIKQWNANRLDLFALTLPNEVRINV